MASTGKVLGCTLVALGVSACSGDGASPSDPELEAYLARAEESRLESGAYIIEWDLMFPDEAALRGHYDQQRLEAAQHADERATEAGDPIVMDKLAVMRQLSTGFVPTFTPNDALDLDYCVSNAFANKANVVTDVRAAATAWERVANVRFKYDASQDASCTASNSAVDFAVMPTTMGTACGINKLMWPASSTGGGCTQDGTTFLLGVLVIDYGDFPLQPPIDYISLGGVLRHELGHLLGFRHEHGFDPGTGCPEETDQLERDLGATRLTDYDVASVMHYPYCSGTFEDMIISERDGVGSRAVYGMPTAWWSTSVNLW